MSKLSRRIVVETMVNDDGEYGATARAEWLSSQVGWYTYEGDAASSAVWQLLRALEETEAPEEVEDE